MLTKPTLLSAIISRIVSKKRSSSNPIRIFTVRRKSFLPRTSGFALSFRDREEARRHVLAVDAWAGHPKFKSTRQWKRLELLATRLRSLRIFPNQLSKDRRSSGLSRSTKISGSILEWACTRINSVKKNRDFPCGQPPA